MKQMMVTTLVALFAAGACWAGERPALKSDMDRTNYSVGFQVGSDFRTFGVELNAEALIQGIRDALAKAAPMVPPEKMQATLVELKRKIVADEAEQRMQKAERHQREGRAFLEQNARKEGVKTLPSGLQYRIITEGTGKKPTLMDSVTVNYRGTRIDGREFDGTYRENKTRTFPLASAIPGWQEALPMMKEGAKWQIFIPATLAFGERGLLADQVVIYEIELVSVQAPK